MWFNNALIYHYNLDATIDLDAALANAALKPCPPHARFIYGWLPTLPDLFAQEVSGCSLICMGKEERLLPRSVINQQLVERITALEEKEGRTLKRAEKTQMAEDIEFELLPKAFCLEKRQLAMLDHVGQRLIVNTSSQSQASQFASLLRKTVPEINIEPLPHAENLAIRFASWITNPSSLPPSFNLASNCLLFALDDEKKRFNCTGCELPAEEILTLLSQGLAAAELSLIWRDRIQFTLTQDLTFKRVKCLDYLTEEFNDMHDLDDEHLQEDAALVLLSGEWRALTNELLADLSSVASPAVRNDVLV